MKKNNKLSKGIIRDVSLCYGKSNSQILEDAILDQYVDPYWLPIINLVYEQDLNIGQFLSLIWMNTDVIGNRDMVNIVKFAADASKRCTSDRPDPDNPEWYHFCGLLDSLRLYIMFEARKTGSSKLDQTALMLTDIIDSYKNGNIKSGLNVIYQIILDNWDTLCHKDKIYNLLGSLSEMCEGQNLSSDRMTLIGLLNSTKD